MNHRIALATIVSLVAVAACTLKTSSSSDDTAAPGDDVSQTESNTESFGSMFVGGDSSGLAVQSFAGGDLRAAGGVQILGVDGGVAAGGGVGSLLQPAGCLTETEDPANRTNTYVFADCTGPFGLVHLTGTVVVAYAVTSPTTLTLSYSAQDFQINRATITQWTASATITANGNDRDMVWSAMLTGTTGSGRDFSRTNNKDIKWTVGVPCVAISGTSEGSVTGHNLKTTVTSYDRCAFACPEANSDIDILNEDTGENVDIHFDGGAKATITVSGAKSDNGTIDIPLACGL
jgi:hypothetical protein